MELKQSRGTVILSCVKCGKEFNRQACQHRANLRRGRTKTFCSTKCAGREHKAPLKVKTEFNRIKAARQSFREACPKCKERSFAVIETKITAKGYRRRRKSCLECGYRMTTIEMPIDDVKNKVDTGIRETVDNGACTSCDHNTNNRCGFSLPEYMSSESHDCNLYTRCTG